MSKTSGLIALFVSSVTMMSCLPVDGGGGSLNGGVQLTFESLEMTSRFVQRIQGVRMLSFDEKLWVIGGYGVEAHSGLLNDVWSSRDGKSWELVVEHAPFEPRYLHAAVVFDGAMWVLGGRIHTDGTAKNDVWKSVNGRDWEQVTGGAPYRGRSSHSAIVFNGKIWIMGGEGWSADVWSSSDGKDWKLETNRAEYALSAERFYLSTAVLNDKLWILGGNLLGVGPQYDTWSSVDGINWQQASANGYAGGRFRSVIAYKDTLFSFGEGGFPGDVVNENCSRSVDGIVWEQFGDCPRFGGMPGVAVLHGRIWVARGDGSVFVSSLH